MYMSICAWCWGESFCISRPSNIMCKRVESLCMLATFVVTASARLICILKAVKVILKGIKKTPRCI